MLDEMVVQLPQQRPFEILLLLAQLQNHVLSTARHPAERARRIDGCVEPAKLKEEALRSDDGRQMGACVRKFALELLRRRRCEREVDAHILLGLVP